jgi:hypothetical protein
MFDREGRITLALQELLRELGAWPAPSSDVTVPQHVLSLEQIDQICDALSFMPEEDYVRTILHLDLQCNDGQLPAQDAHRILVAVAAKSHLFLPTGELAAGHSGVFLLEGLASGKQET